MLLMLMTAIGLMLVFEGILPFVSPNFWRRIMEQMILQNDRNLRIIGLTSMLLGLGMVTLAHNFF